jgi:gamma-glutamyl phosphate reductase
MTDGQWVWMMVHMSIDNDEQLEKVCKSCQEKSKEDRCTSCNALLDVEVNPNFDEELFEKLKNNAE